MASFSSLVCDGSWSGAIKLLDKGLAEAKAGGGDGEVEYSLLMNRAFCNQRLKLYRKALKVCGERWVGLSVQAAGRPLSSAGNRSLEPNWTNEARGQSGCLPLRSDSGKMGSGQVGVVNFRLETSMYRSSGIVRT
eukprot:gene29975-18042_t